VVIRYNDEGHAIPTDAEIDSLHVTVYFVCGLNSRWTPPRVVITDFTWDNLPTDEAIDGLPRGSFYVVD